MFFHFFIEKNRSYLIFDHLNGSKKFNISLLKMNLLQITRVCRYNIGNYFLIKIY